MTILNKLLHRFRDSPYFAIWHIPAPDAQDIFSRIDDGILKRRAQTDVEPESLYVGTLELAKIKQGLNEIKTAYVKLPSQKPKSGKLGTVCGLNVYEVNAESHFGVY